ncbi:MAG: TIGR04282 family arsenosugar biosynthesis glycosyltransferase [Desulforhopalus sp.]|nr:TIGR04282 family arsenosugar biosynthesis glycosyltransferase [Desulforhopalus sp.]
MTNCDVLLLFTRYPDPGHTKTRLIPELGAAGAARLQKLLTERVVGQARTLNEKGGIASIVHYSGGSRDKMAAWLGPMSYETQAEGDLGLRMQTAFASAFAGGAKRAVLIGSDIPDLTAALLAEAFTALRSAEVVIGPSRDGGYYLIGMQAEAAHRLYPLLFNEMIWSTAEVFTKTIRRLASAAISPTVLATLRDIDTPEDLDFARAKGLL